MMTEATTAGYFDRADDLHPESTAPGQDPPQAKEKPPRSYWLVLAFLALLYMNLPFVFPASEALRPAMIVAVLGILALLSETVFGKRPWTFALPEGGLLIVFLTAAMLSCVTALWPGYAFENFSNTLVKMGLFYFVIVNSVFTERTIQGVMSTMVFFGLFPALGTINDYLHGYMEEGRASWVGIFANPNEVSYSLVILLPFAAYLIQKRGWLVRIALIGTSLIFLPAIFVTFSRGGLVGLAAAALIYAYHKRSFGVIATLAVIGGAAYLFAGQYWSRGQDFSQLSNDVSFQQRIATSQAGIDMFLDHPLTGVGLSCSVIAWPLYAPAGLYTRGALVTHNTVIQSLSETGLVGFIPFVTMILVAIFHMRQLARDEDNDIASIGTAVEASLWGLVVCGMSGGYVVTWFPYLLLALAGSARRFAAGREVVGETE